MYGIRSTILEKERDQSAERIEKESYNDQVDHQEDGGAASHRGKRSQSEYELIENVCMCLSRCTLMFVGMRQEFSGP